MQNKLTPNLDEFEFKNQVITLFDIIFDGKINSLGTVTITANSNSTIVTDRRIGVDSSLLLIPKTANAAAALANIYQEVIDKFQITLHHANNSQTNRDFKYVILG